MLDDSNQETEVRIYADMRYAVWDVGEKFFCYTSHVSHRTSLHYLFPPETAIAKSGHLLTHQSQRVHSIGFSAIGNPSLSSTSTFCSHNSIQIWQRLHHLSNTCMVIWGRLLFFFFKRYLNFVFLDSKKYYLNFLFLKEIVTYLN